MGTWKSNLTRTHGLVLVGLLTLFTLWTFAISSAGIDDGPKHARRVLQTTAATLTGPLTGAIARDLQGCCLRFSLEVFLVCAPVLVIGFLSQGFGDVRRRWVRTVHMTLWTLGWLCWFLGGIFSFAHALS